MKKFDNVVDLIIKSLRQKPELSSEGKKLKYISEADYELIMETASVFRYDVFKRFIDYIETIPEEGIPKILTQDDMKLLGLNVSKFRKKGTEMKDKDLCIIKLDFSDRSDYSRMKFISHMEKIDPLAETNKPLFDSTMNRIFSRLKEANGVGCYMKFQDEMGLLLCSTNSSENERRILYHEIIHYLQDVTGNGRPDIESIIEQNFGPDAKEGTRKKFSPIQLDMNLLPSIDRIPAELIKNLLNVDDVVAYINNIALVFQKNGATAQEALDVINEIIREANAREGEDRKKVACDLEQKITNDIPLLKGIGTEASVLALIAVYKQHRTLLKKTIGNYLQGARNNEAK